MERRASSEPALSAVESFGRTQLGIHAELVKSVFRIV
jgi:hypothetical protein